MWNLTQFITIYGARRQVSALCVQVAGATAHEHNAVLLSPWIIPLVEFQIKKFTLLFCVQGIRWNMKHDFKIQINWFY